MSFSVKITTASITIRESDHVEVEEIIRLYRDDKELTQVVERYVIPPDADLTGKNDRASMIAKVARTAKDAREVPITPSRA